MKQLFFMAGIAIALSITACKKDKKQPGTDNGGTTTKLLKKVTKTEHNETLVYNISYDGNKRPTSIASTDNSESTIFTYDAAGNVVKVEDNERDFKNIYTYTYNNGVPAGGSFKSWQRENGEQGDLIEDDVLSYTVTNNQVTKIHLNMTQTSQETDFNLTYHSNGNLAKVTNSDASMYTATFTYGNKKPAFPTISKYILDQAGFSLQFVAKNEILSASFDFPGTQFDKTITTQYTYDANGYVLTSNDGETKLTFEYQ
jgi:YD repeat-containing protein